MKMAKKMLSVFMVVVTLVSLMGIVAEAASISVSKLNLGYMMPTNSKGTKTIETVKLYGDYDYINFYINSKKSDSYFFYEIYSDKNYTKAVDGDFVLCDKGTYTFTPKIKLKGTYKTKTYYMVTYAAKIYSDGSAKIDQNSMYEFTIKVDRSPDFDEKIVVLKETKNTTKGAYIKWGKLSGASKYEILRRSITGTKWKTVGTVSSKKDSFTDTSVKSKNGNYIYTVRAINKKGTKSRYLYSGLTCLFAKTPVLESVVVKADDYIEVTWENTSSEAKYNIMRKEGNGKWKTIKKNYSGTTYNDGNAKNGKKYTYSVKAVISTDYGTATSSYYANDSKAITLYDAPELKVIDIVETGLRVSWYAVSDVSAYKIMRKPYDGSADWVDIGTVDSSTLEFIDTTANVDEEYVYTVRSMGDGFEGSYSSKGVNYIKLGTPTNLRYVEDYNVYGDYLLWNSVNGAEEYEIYRKINSKDWMLYSTRRGDYASCILYGCSELGVIQYKVRAKAGEGHYGEFSEPISVENYLEFYFDSDVSDKQISLSWSKYKAESFNLYRKEASQDDSQYVLLTNTTEHEYVDTDIENDVLYTYQVRAIVEGEEQTANLTSFSTGVSTTLTGNPRIQTDDRRIRFHNAQEVYGYNYGTGEWELLTGYDSKENTKENHAAYCQDGKYRYSFVFIDKDGMRSIRENNIVDHEWYSTVVDFSAEETADGMKITINNPSPEIVEYEIDVGGMSKVIKTDGSSSYSHTFSAFYQGSTDLVCPIYTVVAKNANGDTSTTSKEYWYMDAPEIASLSRTSKGYVKIKIEQFRTDVDKCDGIYIYRKAAGESKYTKIKTLEKVPPTEYGYIYTTYTDKTAKKGVKYTYLVKSYKEYKGEMFVSYYDKATIKK